MAADRVAGRRRRAGKLFPFVAVHQTHQEAAHSHRHAALAHRARLSRPQGRARARPLRRTSLSRLASPCLGRTQLLRVHRRGTRAAFSPLGWKVASSRLAPALGLNVTSPTVSSLHDSLSRGSLPPGYRVAQRVIELHSKTDAHVLAGPAQHSSAKHAGRGGSARGSRRAGGWFSD